MYQTDYNAATFSNCQTIQGKKKQNPADLNCSIDQINLKDIYRTGHPTATEYICSSAHMEHSPGQSRCWLTKQALTIQDWNDLKYISDQNCVKLQISNRKNVRNSTDMQKLRYMLLNSELMKIKHSIQKPVEDSKSHSEKMSLSNPNTAS